MRYMASLAQRGVRVKMLGDYYSRGVRRGDTGSVVRVCKNKHGRDCVTVRFERVGRDVDVWCGNIELLD